MQYAAEIKWLDDIVKFDLSMAEKTGPGGDEDKLDDLDIALKKRKLLEEGDIADDLNALIEAGAMAFQGVVFLTSRGKDREMIASAGKGDRITRMGQIKVGADEELNVGDDRLGKVEKVRILGADGKPQELDPARPEYAEMTRTLAEMTAKLMEISRKLEAEGFSPAEIEREVWSPVVRMRAFPADQVPNRYSHYAQVMAGASALYEEVLENADGTVGEERFGDKLLGGLRDVVDVGKVFGQEFLRYENNPIIESTRVDLSKWIEWNKEGKAEWMEKIPEGKSLKAFVKECRITNNDSITADHEAELNEDPYNMDDETEGLSGEELEKKQAEIIAEWSKDQSDDIISRNAEELYAEPYNMKEGMSAEEKAEILAQWSKDNPTHPDAELAGKTSAFTTEHHNIQMGERTDMFGDSVKDQAYFAGACAAVDMSLNAAEQARKKKKQQRVSDWVEIGAQGALGMIAAGLKFDDDNIDSAIDENEQTKQFQEKYGVAAARAGMKGIVSIIRLAEAGGDAQKIEAAITGALTGLLETIGAGVAAGVGEKTEDTAASTDPTTGEYTQATYDDNRKMAANIELALSAAGSLGVGVKNLVKLARNKDWEAFGLEMTALLTSAGAIGAVEAGGKLRVQVDDAEITEENYGAAGGIYNESENQGAQGTYGFSGDMVTASDQKELERMQAELNASLATFKTDDSGAEIQAAFNKLRNKVDSLPGAREAAADLMHEAREELRQQMAEADPEAILKLTDGDAGAAAAKAMKKIEELTIQLKKDEARLNMLTGGAKFILAAVAQAAPGVSIGVKVFDLLNDIRILVMRVQQLALWRQNLVDSFENYSIYTSAAAGEHDLKAMQTTMDSIKVAADILGVTAESLRVADATHIGASVATTLEKSMKVLSAKWYKHWSKKKIADGWAKFKLARDYPENRRLAREAIRMNSTLAKCVLAYGACVERDPIATRMVGSCGLTPEVLEDDSDVCQAVVTYLEAKLGTDTAVKGAHGGDDWFPKDPEISFEVWTMFKATATTLDPPLQKSWFKSNPCDAAMKSVAGDMAEIETLIAKDAAAKPDLDRMTALHKGLDGLQTLLTGSKPTGDGENGPIEHHEMKLAMHAFAIEVKSVQDNLQDKIVATQKALAPKPAQDDED